MPLLKCVEMKKMSLPDREDKMKELKSELMHERGVAAMGCAPTSPGKIRALRKQIARLETVMREEGR